MRLKKALVDGSRRVTGATLLGRRLQRKAALEKRGVFCGIIERRVRGQADLAQAQKAHNKWCSKFRAFVEHPFAWMKQSDSLWRTRYRGMVRNALDFVLTVIVQLQKDIVTDNMKSARSVRADRDKIHLPTRKTPEKAPAVGQR